MDNKCRKVDPVFGVLDLETTTGRRSGAAAGIGSRQCRVTSPTALVLAALQSLALQRILQTASPPRLACYRRLFFFLGPCNQPTPTSVPRAATGPPTAHAAPMAPNPASAATSFQPILRDLADFATAFFDCLAAFGPYHNRFDGDANAGLPLF